MKSISTPVVLFIFKRLDTTKQVLNRIKEVRPPKMYIVGEGHRPNVEGEKELVERVRTMVESMIDWPCEVHKNYVSEDIGVGRRMSSGIDWVFENEEKAIFLEDDILVDTSFFYYAEEMLNRYENDERIMMVSGFREVRNYNHYNNDSYFFARFASIWGWASWRRAWKEYDFSMSLWNEAKKDKRLRKYYHSDYAYQLKASHFDRIINGLDTWDYQWDFARLNCDGLSIVPAKNLVTNCGFRADATHTINKNSRRETVGIMSSLVFPLTHPDEVIVNAKYDEAYENQNYKKPTYAKRMIMYIKLFIKKGILGR